MSVRASRTTSAALCLRDFSRFSGSLTPGRAVSSPKLSVVRSPSQRSGLMEFPGWICFTCHLAASRLLWTCFASLNQGHAWCLQLTNGAVTSLAKGNQAEGADAYRPVTVYPAPYRIWSSFRSRAALQAVVQHLPVGIQGGIPGG